MMCVSFVVRLVRVNMMIGSDMLWLFVFDMFVALSVIPLAVGVAWYLFVYRWEKRNGYR